jgi:hypothetical protein
MDPTLVDFKAKVITHGDKSFPVHRQVMISNPDLYELTWRADTSRIDEDRIFMVKPKEGTLESGGSFNLTVSFNPSVPEEYEGSVDFYLDN